jgi:hypothetical protein
LIGGWSSDKHLEQIGGLFNLLFIDQSLEGFALFLLKQVLRWEYSAIQVLVGEMRTALKSPRNTPYYVLYVLPVTSDCHLYTVSY